MTTITIGRLLPRSVPLSRPQDKFDGRHGLRIPFEFRVRFYPVQDIALAKDVMFDPAEVPS